MKFFEWIQKWNDRKNGRKIGKSDWIILILVGVLLMVVVWPTGSSESRLGNASESSDSSAASAGGSADSSGRVSASAGSDSSSAVAANDSSGTDSLGTDSSDTVYSDTDTSNETSYYISALEDELTELLGTMAGVGKVRVMITLENDGQTVLQTDSLKSENSSTDSTVILEQGDEELPYITSQITPTVQGVVVVAQGAGSGDVQVEITEAVIALFGIEAHKVKVLPME